MTDDEVESVDYHRNHRQMIDPIRQALNQFDQRQSHDISVR